MSIRRERAVEERLRERIEQAPQAPGPCADLDAPLRPPHPLTARQAIALVEGMLTSRLADLEARRLKDAGRGYYTIGSAGHEPNAVLGALTRIDDPAFLHYRSGALFVARARQAHGQTPLFDLMLSFAASAEDPISGGRHKVIGSRALWIPPQTSTIASHLPKAAGTAIALERMRHLGLPLPVPEDAIVLCSFGDASVNHATAQAGFQMAQNATLHRQRCPILFVCEDNGIGISVRTPADAVEKLLRPRFAADWFGADGRDLPAAHAQAGAAIEHCRRTRRPTFLHLRVIRLMGHAGTDVETTYRSLAEIEANEALDPLLPAVDLLLGSGALSRRELIAMYDELAERVRRAGEEACRRPRLASAAEVQAPLALPAPDRIAPPPVASEAVRSGLFGGEPPEADPRRRHLAFRIPQALKDLFAALPAAFLFGEDVAAKGGVYHATEGMAAAFGAGRVFNTVLDETSILGLAQGFAQLGALPFPEIQYLAYLHNAIDQLRGEAASLQFFSNRQFRNGFVLRIAGLAYQKGFGGHFHNDHALNALLEIPGLAVAVPSRGDDAAGILRTCAMAAVQHGTVSVVVEPIALYMTRDLFDKNDGLWASAYPPPQECVPLGSAREYDAAAGDDLVIVTFGNGVPMALQARRLLLAEGLRARVLDLRWLAPLPLGEIRRHAHATGRVLVVDECRSHGGPSARIVAALAEDPELDGLRLRRISAADTYLPLGPAADLVLVQVGDVVAAARALCAEPRGATTA
jgi:2-oxoisovalerate dehydrogenase E1 component